MVINPCIICLYGYIAPCAIVYKIAYFFRIFHAISLCKDDGFSVIEADDFVTHLIESLLVYPSINNKYLL
jgi:hypothetical protein